MDTWIRPTPTWITTFIGSLVYQADAELEAAQRGEQEFAAITPWSKRKLEIIALLRELGIHDPRVEALLDDVGTYWDLETELVYQGKVTAETLTKAIALRSSDLLAYHRLCLHMAQVENREEIFSALVPWQIYIEFAFDLFEYEQDLAAGDYNTYCMFVKLYGSAAPRHIEAEIKRYWTMTEEALARLPAPLAGKLRTVFDGVLADIGGFPAIPTPILE